MKEEFSPSAMGALSIVAIVAASGTYARAALSPLQESIRTSVQLSDAQIALLQGPALALPLVLLSVPMGMLIDRFSRVRLLLLLGIGNLVGTLLTAVAPGFLTLFAARCLVGLTATSTVTAAFSLAADLCSRTARGRAAMVLSICQYGGISAVFAAAGWLLMDREDEFWREALLWLASPLLFVLAGNACLREPFRGDQVVAHPSTRDVLAELWSYRVLLGPMLTGVVAAEVALGCAMVWGAPALSRAFVLEPSVVGGIMSIGMLVTGLIAPLAGGVLADAAYRRGGVPRTFSAISTLCAFMIPTCAFSLCPSLLGSSILLIAMLATSSAIGVMGTALFMTALPNEIRGVSVALLFGACTLFAVGLAPVFVSLLSAQLGGEAMIGRALSIVSAVTAGIAILALQFGRRRALEAHDTHV